MNIFTCNNMYLTLSENNLDLFDEKMDGSGYPDGLKGEEIPFSSQILCVSDIYNALVTNRPYRNKFTSNKAIAIMEEMPINQDLVKILKTLLRQKKI